MVWPSALASHPRSKSPTGVSHGVRLSVRSSSPFPGLPPPPPPPETEPSTPRLPRKSSFSTLRSVITKKGSVTTLRSVRSTKSSHPFASAGPVVDCPAFTPPIPPGWRVNEVENHSPVTPRRRTPKTSIGAPRLQASTSPSAFLKDIPRRAPSTPKASDFDIPPIPDLLQEMGYGTPGLSPSTNCDTPMTNLDTPGQDEEDAAEVIRFDTSPPLTVRSAQESLKPKRLLNLLPKQQRANMGLSTPPSGVRVKKTTTTVTSVLRTPLADKTSKANIPIHLRGLGGVSTPDSISSVLSKAEKSQDKRGPLAMLRRGASSTPSPGVPIKSHEVHAWAKSGIESKVADPNFGAPIVMSRQRPTIPDFTASPDNSLDLSDISLDSATLESIGTFGRRGSTGSVDSDLPTEEWELEAYLKELDRVDNERAAAATA